MKEGTVIVLLTWLLFICLAHMYLGLGGYLDDISWTPLLALGEMAALCGIVMFAVRSGRR